jgi:hypothetical protein
MDDGGFTGRSITMEGEPIPKKDPSGQKSFLERVA